MIHYWECDRCTHQWRSSCMEEMTTPKEERERNHRQLSSGLCWDCFEQLETGEISGLELFNLVFYLEKKSEKYAGKSHFIADSIYSGMCHPYKSDVYGPDGNTIIEKGNFESGTTAEEEQLHKIVQDILEVYRNIIKQQRTIKRIELDEFQKTAGLVLFGSQPRPEGFIGDPPGKQRFEILCGLDMGTGNFIAPTIKMNDGSNNGI